MFSHRSRFNRSFLHRALEHRQEKRAIAAAALEYIQDGDTIILDAGTTTLALAQLLKEQVKSAFVITCSVPVALELSTAGYDILLLGGIVRNKSLALLGRETLRIIERYRADKAFLGSTGFTAETGHSTPNPDDAQIKEALIRIAEAHALPPRERMVSAMISVLESPLAMTKQLNDVSWQNWTNPHRRAMAVGTEFFSQSTGGCQ